MAFLCSRSELTVISLNETDGTNFRLRGMNSKISCLVSSLRVLTVSQTKHRNNVGIFQIILVSKMFSQNKNYTRKIKNV